MEELINYLKVARRSKEVSDNSNYVLARILNENGDEQFASILKNQLTNFQFYRTLDNELAQHDTVYLSLDNNHRKYYTKLVVDLNGHPTTRYRELFSDTSVDIADNFLIALPILYPTGYYYGIAANNIIELTLEEVIPQSDWYEYHPLEIQNIENGTYLFDYKDENGNSKTWDIIFTPIFKDYRLNRRNVNVAKNLLSGNMYIFPILKKESSESYVLNYYYRKKGDLIYFLEEEATPAITLRFAYIGACLAFLNHTIFYSFNSGDGFETPIRRKFFNQYKNIVYAELNNVRHLPISYTLEILYFIPRGLLSIVNKEYLWEIAIKAIDESLHNVGTDSEDIILAVLTALADQETPDEFLNRLLKARPGNKTVFALIYKKMNGTNFVKLIQLFRQIWLKSSYTDISNQVFSQSDGPLLLPYKSEKYLGFYSSNKNFDFLSNDFIEVTADEHWIDELGSVVHKEIGEGLNELFEDQIKFKYHPFQPIYLTEVIKESPLELPKLLPAFFLKANEDKAFWSNVITAVEYTVDVVTTLSGVGNLAKFRYLARLGEAGSLITKIKLGAGIVEVASGVTNTLLKLTGLNDTEAGKALQEYLFYLELLSLSGELTASIKNGLQKSAKEVLEHSDDLEKQLDDLIKNGELDEAGKQGLIDELYEVAELDYLAKWDIPLTGPGGKGFLGGQKLGRQEIKLWISKIQNISNGKAVLKIIDETSDTLKTGQAGFNPFTMEIFVKKGVTEYEIFHEFKHLEEFIKLGKDEYTKGWKFIGGSPSDDLIRQYQREMYVYNQVLKEAKKFNKEQLKHAYEENIVPVIRRLQKAGIDVNKIKITK